jgi:hypothetical protein
MPLALDDAEYRELVKIRRALEKIAGILEMMIK